MRRWMCSAAIFFSVLCLLSLCLYEGQKSPQPSDVHLKQEEADWSLTKQAVSHDEADESRLASAYTGETAAQAIHKSERVFGITQVVLRAEPGDDQAQVGILEKNEKAARLWGESGQWDKIRLEDGTEGFVPNDLLTTWLPADGQLDIVYIVDAQEPTPADSEPFAILAPARATVDQARAWAKSKGATETFLGLAELYWSISPSAGVDPAVAYAQSAKETNFGKFTGVLDETYKNPCGMKRMEAGKLEDSDDFIAEAHKRFDSWEDGIMAHVDHLALYAGAQGYPKEETLDPRHFANLFGRCLTVESLGGHWAPSEDYGVSLRRYVEAMMEF